MRITGIRTHRVGVTRRGGWLFVQVETDEGLTGLGEASQGGDDGAVEATVRQRLAPWLEGRDPRDVEPFRQQFGALGAARVGATAVSGVEQALWDLAGQASGVPIWRLLGGALRPRLWLYANINRSTWDRSPAGFAANARLATGAGFRAVKLAAFDDVPRLDTPEAFATIDLGVERVLAVREAVGPGVQVLLDCHGHFNAAWAVRVARRLEGAGLYWVEDPVPRADLDGLVRVRRSIEQPVAAGEQYFGRRPFWDLCTRGAVDVVMPDVKHCGGVLELRQVAALAEPAHVQVAPHNPSGPVALAATAHAAVTMPNFAILEHAFGEVEWRAGLVDPPETIVDGYYTPPDAPGLGLRLDPDALAAHGA